MRKGQSSNKSFCKNCNDRNWLIECSCGRCGQVLSRTDERYRIRNHLYGHYQKERKGELNNFYKYGRFKKDNYWILSGFYGYPNASKDGKIREHVYFYQEYHKVCMLPWAVVHHIEPVTEDYCNNMSWNLEAMMKSEHTRMHYPYQHTKRNRKLL